MQEVKKEIIKRSSTATGGQPNITHKKGQQKATEVYAEYFGESFES